MIGSARMIPAYIDSLNVVRNGSAGLSVIGFLPAGSGPLTTSSSRWFCQKQRPTATASTARQTMIRVRSSSRCSTRVRRSSNRAVRRRATGYLRAVLGDYFALNRLAGLLAWPLAAFDLRLLVLVVIAPRDRRAELADPPPERASKLRKPLRPEDDQGDDENDQDLWKSDVAWHPLRWYSGARPGGLSRLPVLEVAVVARRGGAALALVLRLRSVAPVRRIGRSGHPQEGDLA